MTWKIDKQFSFCYGHRVWSQRLKEDYCEAGDTACKCRHLHGHEGLVHVFLEADKLEHGMVTDFKHLGWLKNFIDSVLDHRFVIDEHDPMFDQLVTSNWDYLSTGEVKFKQICVPGTDVVVAHEIDTAAISEFADTATFEVLQGYTIVDFVPTSENFSRWLFDVVSVKMEKIGVKTSQIDWFETPKSRSSYSG